MAGLRVGGACHVAGRASIENLADSHPSGVPGSRELEEQRLQVG